ncbi:hypothetical protein [Paenibacillus sp. NPDC057967]|uniref:hypothetical protein n=1 Tax=Paenibacillus sp. NPDC057967 TaxID=3346293 RepID=UPI0036D8D3B8
MRNHIRFPLVFIGALLLCMSLAAGCSNDEFHMKLRLLDQEWIENKLIQEGFSFEEKDLFEIYRLDVEGLRSQKAYELDDNESSLYMYIFDSEEEQFQGRKQLERQTIALSYKPAYYDINNALLIYTDGGVQDDSYKERIDELARNMRKK